MYKFIMKKLSVNPIRTALGAALGAGLGVGAYYYYYRPQQDRITIGLYSTQNGENYHPAALQQTDAVKKIKVEFAKAAENAERTPPETILSTLLIPDWKQGSHFQAPSYLIAKAKLFNDMQNKLDADPDLEDVVLEDFYNKKSLTSEEKAYLEGLQAKGSNADMIKSHAIICPENRNRRHLQLDSNTLIPNFQSLYNRTFGAKKQRDGLNASYYDHHYVSAHNKIIYTTPEGMIAAALIVFHLQYCATHKDDQGEEKVSKNSIYSKAFTSALESVQLTTKKIRADNKVIYPANMQQPQYELTKDVITAVNMSWRDGEKLEAVENLKKLPAITVGSANCDYACFAIVVKIYTGVLSDHGNDIYDDTLARTQLLALHDTKLDHKIIHDFYENTKKVNPQMLEALAQTFPNTKRGNELTMQVFGKNVNALHQEAKELQRLGTDKKLSDEAMTTSTTTSTTTL